MIIHKFNLSFKVWKSWSAEKKDCFEWTLINFTGTIWARFSNRTVQMIMEMIYPTDLFTVAFCTCKGVFLCLLLYVAMVTSFSLLILKRMPALQCTWDMIVRARRWIAVVLSVVGGGVLIFLVHNMTFLFTVTIQLLLPRDICENR